MATTRICQRCGKPVSNFAPDGLCPNCLLESSPTLVANDSGAPVQPPAGRAVPSPPPLPAGQRGDEDIAPCQPSEELDTEIAARKSEISQIANLRVRYFGDYELLEELARGGMGVVYKARQVTLNRTVAVKMILSGQLASAAEVQRFKHEAQSAANLQHPNIVAIHEVGEHEGQHYFSMDYVAGKDLTEWVRHGPLPAKRAAAYLKTIAEAIHYAHGQGVLHRDLKPSNILIDQTDQPRVTDFGLAKRTVAQVSQPAVSPTSSRQRSGESETPRHTGAGAGSKPAIRQTGSLRYEESLTLTGQVLGTPNYMPPEQARGRRHEIGPPGDVFSLGGILFFLLTGRPPFLGETLEETLSQVLHTEPVSPRLLNPSVPRDLETICLKCLEKEVGRRYCTAQDLADELGRFLYDEPIQARPASRAERVWRWCRRKPALAGLAGSTALLLLAVAIGSPIAAFRIDRERLRAEQNAKNEEQQRQRAQAAVTRLELERVEGLFAVDNSSRALAYLARLLRQQPTNRVAAERLISALSRRNFCLPSAPLRHGEPMMSSAYPKADGSSPLISFIRLGGSVRAANFSADGRQVVTASKDGTARVWDVITGQPVAKPLRHEAELMWAQFSPDGRRVVTASLDNTTRIWDAATGAATASPLRHERAVLFAEFSGDNRKVVTASQDKTIRLWDSDTGRPLSRPITNKAAVYFASFTPEEGRLLLATSDGRAWIRSSGVEEVTLSFPHSPPGLAAVPFPQMSRDGNRVVTVKGHDEGGIWDAATRKSVGASLSHDNGVHFVRFSPDGKLVATASTDNSARVWDARTGLPVTAPLGHDNWLESAHFDATGQRLATASRDKSARIWNARTGRALSEPLRHEAWVRAAQFSPDGQRLVTFSDADTAWLWTVRSVESQTVLLRHDGDVRHATFSPDGRRVATGSRDGTARVWDARTGRVVAPVIKVGGWLGDVQFSPDGKRLVTVSDRVQVWDAATGKPVTGRLGTRGGPSNAARFSPDGRRVVGVSFDNAARIWDASTGEEMAYFKHTDKVNCAQFSPDGQRVATASYDGTTRVWEAATGQALTGPLLHEDRVHWVEFSPDGKQLATASKDRTVRLWDAQTGRALLQPLVHTDELYEYHSVQFSPDGKCLATAAAGAAQVWDALTGEPLAPPLQHDGRVNSVSFSPDGQRLITASSDAAARIWDVATGHLLSDPLRHTMGRVQYAEFSPDGRLAVTASSDGTARVWEIAPAPLPIPDWLPELAEALAGQRIDSRDISTVVPVEELFRLRQRLGATGGADYYAKWARWFFAPGDTRALSASLPGVQVNLDKDFRFLPQGWPLGLAPSQTQAGGLRRKPYERLIKEPAYHSTNVLYGYFELGNAPDHYFTFVVDDLDQETWSLWVDANNNNDLTDDGPPLGNQGTGKLAATVALEAEVITPASESVRRPYQLWFWINETPPPREFPAATPDEVDRAITPRFYATCHYEGKVSIDGEVYPAIVFETRHHNALYRDSGLWIDLNRDGKLDEKSEHFDHHAVLRVGDKEYELQLDHP